MAALVDLVLPIPYPEASSGVREGSLDIHIMALVTIRLPGIPMSTHILAQVMLLIPSIPTVIQDEGNQSRMALEGGERGVSLALLCRVPIFPQWR